MDRNKAQAGTSYTNIHNPLDYGICQVGMATAAAQKVNKYQDQLFLAASGIAAQKIVETALSIWTAVVQRVTC